jgi:hypothetical protein
MAGDSTAVSKEMDEAINIHSHDLESTITSADWKESD